MPIEGLDPRQKLVVVPDIDQHLCVVLDALPIRVQEAETKGDIGEQAGTCGSEFMAGNHGRLPTYTDPKRCA